MVVADLKDKIIFIDTVPLIYYIEGHSRFQSFLSEIFKACDEGKLSFNTSVITLLEVLVKPLKEGSTAIAEQYRNILTSAKGITITDTSADIAAAAARLRADYSFKTPDSIQLATAIESNADFFLTNDSQLKRFTDIPVLCLSDIVASK